jgi:hypothetical protein
VPGLALSSLLRERLKERKTKADPHGVGGRCARRRPLALVRADSSLHGVTECLGIRAPAPGIVPGEISFDIGQVHEVFIAKGEVYTAYRTISRVTLTPLANC